MMNSENQDYFDFTTQEELPDEYTIQKRNCPFCSKPIPADSLFCLYCGEPVSDSKDSNKNKWIVFLVFFVLIALLFWMFIV